jgi:hypothetical protein
MILDEYFSLFIGIFIHNIFIPNIISIDNTE